MAFEVGRNPAEGNMVAMAAASDADTISHWGQFNTATPRVGVLQAPAGAGKTLETIELLTSTAPPCRHSAHRATDLLSAAELAQVVDFLAIVNERELWQDAALGSGHMGVSGSTMGGGGFRNAQLIGLDKQDGHPVPQLLYRRVFEAVVALNAEHWQFHLPAEPASVCIETMQVRQ